jgi:hypothetical protein
VGLLLKGREYMLLLLLMRTVMRPGVSNVGGCSGAQGAAE